VHGYLEGGGAVRAVVAAEEERQRLEGEATEEERRQLEGEAANLPSIAGLLLCKLGMLARQCVDRPSIHMRKNCNRS
jgi:hypothetical protein